MRRISAVFHRFELLVTPSMACLPPPAGQYLPEIYLGSLSGNGTQTNPPESWPVTMFFSGGLVGETVGSDDYPTLRCRASLTLERANDDGSIVLTEHITEGLGMEGDALTSELNTAFLAPAKGEHVYCTANILKFGKRSIYGVAQCHGKKGGLFTHHTVTYVRPA